MITVVLTPTAPYTPKSLRLIDASPSLTLGRIYDDVVCSEENGSFPCEIAKTLNRRHAELFVGEKSKVCELHFVMYFTLVYIKDLGSSNGNFVNEVKVDAPVEVKSGDTVRLGIDLESINGTYANDGKVTGAPIEVKDGDVVRLGVDVEGPPRVQGEYKAVVAKRWRCT